MDKPLTVWYCDTCGKPIHDHKEGRVIWQASGGMESLSFKIVHQTACDRGDWNASANLRDFFGVEGLTHLLAFLSSGPDNVGGKKEQPPIGKNLDGYVDFFRRVQVPYYEEARLTFKDPDYLEHVREHGVDYRPDQLAEVVRQFVKAD